MADLTVKETGEDAGSSPITTGSISWTDEVRGICVVAGAQSVGLTTSTITMTGGGATWTDVMATVGDHKYQSRRLLAIFVTTGHPTDGALTITYNNDGGTFSEMFYEVYELANYDNTTPYDAAVSAGQENASNSGTSLTLSSIGTVDASDVVLAAGACENGADSFAFVTGITLVGSGRGGGSDVRQLIVGTGTDDTPGVDWTTSGGHGGKLMALIFNDGEQASGSSPSVIAGHLAGPGGLAGSGGLAGNHGGIAG